MTPRLSHILLLLISLLPTYLQAEGVPQRAVYFTAHADRTSLYEGQTTVVRYDIHLSPGVTVSGQGIALSHKPDTRSFVIREFPINSIKAQSENGAGSGLRGQVKKLLVVPQQAGKLTLPGVTYDCSILLRSVAGADPLVAFFDVKRAEVQRTTPALHFDVRPLPTPRPANFTGGVGHFSVRLQRPDSALRVGQTALLRLVVSGTGNLTMLSAPQWPTSADVRFSAPHVADSTRLSESGETGQIFFDYPFTPLRAGTIEVPALTFSYFNPASGRYEQLRTEAFQLSGVEEAAAQADADTSQADTKTPALVVSAMIKTIVVALMLVAGAFYFLKRKKKSRAQRPDSKRAAKDAKQLMATALKTDEPATTVRTALEKYAVLLLGSDVLPPRDALASALVAAGVKESQAERIVGLLQRADAASYAPMSSVDAEELQEEAQALLQQLS